MTVDEGIEVRRMDGARWVKLSPDLAVVPIRLLDDLREHWSGKLADAVMNGEAVVNVFGDGKEAER
jgi:hypothetical protein